jgi:phosphatidylglycerophosphate synthase
LRPWHLTLTSAGLSALAVTTLISLPTAHAWAAVLVWGAWLCDRLDGALARRQQSATAAGAWLDGNLDEANDVALHIAVAVAAAALWPAATTWVWALLITFVAAKYLLIHGLWTEANLDTPADTPWSSARAGAATSGGVTRRLYHLPGNADVRVHVLLLALATGWLAEELVFVAGYYTLRVAVRYPLVVARLKGGAA